MPDQFVLKCTHDSGGVVVCKDKNTLDIQAAKKKLKYHLKRNQFWYGREWPYKNVKPRIIAEKYMDELNDYKVMCFNGIAKVIQLHMGRFKNHTQDFFDVEWKKLFVMQGCPNSNIDIPSPLFLNEMLTLSEKLSENICHVRVDWYYTNNHLYFGELTFYDGAGFIKFEPIEMDYIFGNYINLPEITVGK